ncbi:CHASE2 domain-containing protein [Roseitalea porphyridii]|uniref:Adenylate/guanylate cyclase domain-containing protein n=1 Tax=Roseitalea porphyridii TaxID=1852022 RepID=A0A4P6V4E4_9HYPH|nr:adenylate/guanylate cyclase domain-containing protein [Roseitalea porphyridii]QBK31526.1 adenylate/guanylate cyclase domain-containing protein [Roseitalea porphyridii]
MEPDAGLVHLRLRSTGAPAVFALFALVLVLAAVIALAGPLAPLRERGFDLYQSLAPIDLPLDRVAIVAIDEATLAEHGRWPWPRERVGALVATVANSGAAAIGLDLLFPEPDASPGGAASDAALADALAAAPAVLAMTLGEDGLPLSVEPKAGFTFIGAPEAAFGDGYEGGVAPIAPLAEAASGLGVIRSFADADGRMRAIPLVWAERTGQGAVRHWPALSVELLRVAQGERALAVRIAGRDDDALRVGGAIVPLGDGRLRLIDVPASPLRVSAGALLADGSDASLAGRIAILAVDAAGLDRYHLTARGELRLGADLHAIAVSQMIAGRFLLPVPSARLLEWAMLAIGGLMIAAAFAGLGRRPALVAMAALVVVSVPPAAGFTAYLGWGRLIDWTQPVAGLFIVALAGGYGLYRRAERRRALLQEQFGQFLSPQIVKRLAETDTRAALAVEDRPITAMIVDIRGFTALGEALPAERTVELVNHFFAIANAEIFARDGTIDKYMGDAVLAFWNAPLARPDHADTALDAAQAIIARVARENGTLAARGLPEIDVVAAVETGVCSVGNMGTAERIDFTAIGPAVNMVARLEQQTKALGVPVLVGPACAAALKRPVRKVGRVALRGFAGETDVFTPV